MNPMIRHRLYLTARFFAGVLGASVVVVLAVIAAHDYTVQHSDSECFRRVWIEAITQERKKEAEIAERTCTPEVRASIEVRGRELRTQQEKDCFWATAGTLIGLGDAPTNTLRGQCHVWLAQSYAAKLADVGKGIKERFPWAYGDLSDAELGQRVAAKYGLRTSDASGNLEVPVAFSERVWRPRAPGQSHWDADLILVGVAFGPLVTIVGVRRWLVWLTGPDTRGDG